MEYTKELSGPSNWYKKLQFLFKKVLLKKQKTYILPTSFGLVYGLVCFVLLLMAMTYTNNMVYIVCFYLTVMGLALAKMTNDHVDHVFIENVFIKDVFAEADQTLFVTLQNTTAQVLKQIEIKMDKQSFVIKVDLKPQETQTVELLWSPEHRGSQRLPTLHVSSTYPAALFRAWKVLKKKEEVIVFAKRNGLKEFPDACFASQDSIGVLKEIRDYSPGDSPKRIHWRSLAKNQQLRTLVHEGHEGSICHLDWGHVQHLPLESRIEQLTLWISLAESQGAPWVLKLPHQTYDSIHTPGAARLAYTELAVWK